MIAKEQKESLPLWKRLLALSGFLAFIAAALAFPKLGDHGPDVGSQAVTRLRVNVKPTSSEVAWVFRSYTKVTPTPRRFLLLGPVLTEKPLG
ncbi:MAG TPA: hypothetical protein VN915_10885 [Elusimicrobiota bacterium]|nr:hypothetical protein [Elusimicrobiota bacterium]